MRRGNCRLLWLKSIPAAPVQHTAAIHSHTAPDLVCITSSAEAEAADDDHGDDDKGDAVVNTTQRGLWYEAYKVVIRWI